MTVYSLTKAKVLLSNSKIRQVVPMQRAFVIHDSKPGASHVSGLAKKSPSLPVAERIPANDIAKDAPNAVISSKMKQ